MTEPSGYKYLEPRSGSNYRQLFFKGRNLRAETLYRQTVGPEPRTPEEVARDYRVPVEAVLEAIHDRTHHEELLRHERDRTAERIRARGLDRPPFVPADTSSRS